MNLKPYQEIRLDIYGHEFIVNRTPLEIVDANRIPHGKPKPFLAFPDSRCLGRGEVREGMDVDEYGAFGKGDWGLAIVQPQCGTCGRFCRWTGLEWSCPRVMLTDEGYEHW